MSQIGVPLVGSYDYRLVVHSIFIAIFSSYAALDLGGRVATQGVSLQSAIRGRLRLRCNQADDAGEKPPTAPDRPEVAPVFMSSRGISHFVPPPPSASNHIHMY